MKTTTRSLRLVADVGEVDVLDRRALDDLDDVAPAAPVEVVQAALPLDHQVGADELAQTGTVAIAPRGLDLDEELAGLGVHGVGVEDRLDHRGIEGDTVDLGVPGGAPATGGPDLLGHPCGPQCHDRDHREHDQHDHAHRDRRERPDVDAVAEPAASVPTATVATTKAAAPAPAEAGTAAAGEGRGERHRYEHGERADDRDQPAGARCDAHGMGGSDDDGDA